MSEPCVDMDDRCSDCLEIEADLKAENGRLSAALKKISELKDEHGYFNGAQEIAEEALAVEREMKA